MMKAEAVQISFPVFENLLAHLQVHSATDAWAAEVLAQVQADATPIQLGRTASGAYLLDGQSNVEYRLN